MPPEPAPIKVGIKWNEITWYSKLGAIILFIGVVPVLSFYIGTQYEKTQEAINVQAGSQKQMHIEPKKYVSVGDKLGEMTVISVAPFNSGQYSQDSQLLQMGPNNIKVIMRGPIEITGTYKVVHSGIGFDGFCLSDFDTDSLTRLPTLPGETTVSTWSFCFRNEDVTMQTLGTTTQVVTVIIDNYELNSYPAEVVNWADLIEIVVK